VIGQRLAHWGRDVVLAAAGGFGVPVLPGLAEVAAVSQHDVICQLWDVRLAQVRLAQLRLVLLGRVPFGGVLLRTVAPSSLFVAFLVLVVLELDLVRVVKVPDAPGTAVGKHLVGERPPQERSRCILTGHRRAGEVVVIAAEFVTTVVPHDVVRETSSHSVLASWLPKLETRDVVQ